MLYPPRYRLTSKISEFLSSIEASRQVIDSVDIPKGVEINIRRESSLKSALYSARIEGNTLIYDQLTNLSHEDQKKLEVTNMLKALNWVYDHKPKEVISSQILTMHKIAMNKLVDEENLGKYRQNMEAIFNSAGIAIYMPPPPRLITPHIDRLLKYINSERDRLVPVKAVVAHYIFEKIHPFLDGSGRVGRLLIHQILNINNSGFKGFLNLEEYIDTHRSEYYRMLEEPEKDVTDYVEFMLAALSISAIKAKEKVLQKHNLNAADFLLPRRKEIFEMIKDHKLMSFDQIKRRFLKVNARTLRYDLKKLQDQKLIKKLGTTRGAYYTHPEWSIEPRFKRVYI